MERAGLITFKGNPLTLVGPELKPGDAAPDFTAVDGDLNLVRLSDYRGQIVIISAVPSLDTPVCEAQTRRFNEEAARLGAAILTINMDLPFAQKRFCTTHGIENLKVVSDHREREFAREYGLLIKELKLLARAVLILDREGNIAYLQIVREVASQPDYEAVIAAAKGLGSIP